MPVVQFGKVGHKTDWDHSANHEREQEQPRYRPPPPATRKLSKCEGHGDHYR
jgi:hypothetical protein